MTKEWRKAYNSEGGSEGGLKQSPKYRPKKLYAFLSSFVKIGILFHYYHNKILSFLDNAGKNEGSEIYSFPHIVVKYIIFLCGKRGKVDKFRGMSWGPSPRDILRNLLTFLSFPHKNVILFLSEGKVYTFPAKSKKNLYTFPAKCILFPLSVKRILNLYHMAH